MWPLASCENLVHDCVQFRARDCRCLRKRASAVLTRNWLTRRCATPPWHPRNHQDEYQSLGYVPAATGQRNEATSRTLEFAYDDWCIAQMAQALGKTQDAKLFAERSQNYRKVFDQDTKSFRGKTVAGPFHEPFDPKAASFEDYTEANAWQYTFAVMHDVPA